MPFLVMRNEPTVYHIGHLEQEPDGCPGNAGLQVTANPEQWRAIHGANGPEWELRCPTAQWVDVLAMTAEDHRDLQSWMMLEANRYMRPAIAYTVQHFCDETGEISERRFATLEEAASQVGRTVAEELDDRQRGRGAVEDVESFLLQRRALRRLAPGHDPFDWFSAAAFLYVREVVLTKRPFVVGLWWAEVASRDTRTSGHGILMPEALSDYRVESDEVEEQAVTAAFPNWRLPRRKLPLGME